MRLLPRRDGRFRRFLRRLGRTVVDSLGLARRHDRPVHRLVAPGRVPWGPPDTMRHADVAGGSRRPRVVFVSGEPESPGHDYRVARCARAADLLGFEVDVLAADDLTPAWWRVRIPAPAIVVVWRARARPPLEEAIRVWRAAGASILFDVDDLMIDPALATPQVIDGIRSMGLSPADVRATYEGIRRAMLLADACLAPTAALAEAIERAGRPCLVLPNGFDEETYRVSREAVLRRREEPPADGLFRIGYASGSRTHQRDFAVAAPALARLLARRKDCRLVLFREPRRGTPLLDIEEFPSLAGLEDRIEWRALVPLARLPEELARFDVNIAPLEAGNPFCEAKSELKYFESALVEVPTIASPTAPFRGCIRHGLTGLLADSTDAWLSHLETLCQDAAQRRRLGRAAFHDVLHRYGPDGRRDRLRTILTRLHGPPADRSQAFRPVAIGGADAGVGGPGAVSALPVLPAFDVLRRTGSTRLADVAVVVPVFNYGRYVLEALESVAAQSLSSLELVVVDDASTDDSVALVDRWIASRGGRFVSATLARNRENAGLSLTRNAAFSLAEAAFVFPLDADNTLEPRCLAALVERLARSTASAAHPTLQHFGATDRCRPAEPWSPDRLRRGNYIDAMALVRRSAWAAVGGYRKGAFVGWEDYDLWCRFVELGLWSEAVPEAVAGYRVHAASMMRQETNPALDRVVEAIRAEHPWLTVRAA